ncbi:DUF2797 domain-containing protein [Leptospira sp. GIMC2001]|uniref:DUF2797 domain-containing protein n=1 Tax=Leptospira sp. GIMC2001 TaxID=1513297 RepID=UPI00234A9809|nr:DUF2797 domain-containing protein [Leptospira sp. GIMC2001]WCL50495.1 DUF2797 domain-containing protein [Leptospira sp. GIMC2001]
MLAKETTLEQGNQLKSDAKLIKSKEKLSNRKILNVNYKLRYAIYEGDNQAGKKVAKESVIEGEDLKNLLGKKVTLKFTGKIRCVDCGKFTKKSFNQGSCYSCFIKLASNDLCIMQPTRCHYHLGTCREPAWGESNCLQKHSVYIAYTSGPKIGITKEKKIENRWIDQGAVIAIEILETQSRREAGIVETFMSQFLSDRTTWQKMVTENPDVDDLDLLFERDKFFKAIEKANLVMMDAKNKEIPITIKPSKMKESFLFNYPILEYPKAKSLKADPDNPISAKLIGVKGQYLLFDQGVINLRSYEGYEFSLDVD